MQDDKVLRVDARGLEPPQPLVMILEALASLPEGAELQARTDRNPIHLHPMLVERGYSSRTQPAPNHEPGYLTIIRRAN